MTILYACVIDNRKNILLEGKDSKNKVVTFSAEVREYSDGFKRYHK